MTSNESVKSQYSQRAAEDWQTILSHRARELKKGGKLVIINFCADKDGQYLGNTNPVDNPNTYNMHLLFNKFWLSMAKNEGIITEKEYLNTNFANYYRSVEEMISPFQNNTTSPTYKEGLRVISCDTRFVPCPFHRKWLKEKGDPREHAKAFIPTLRTWSNSVFTGGLSEERSESEKNEIVDLMFEKYRKEVEKEPEKHAMDYIHAYLLCEKV